MLASGRLVNHRLLGCHSEQRLGLGLLKDRLSTWLLRTSLLFPLLLLLLHYRLHLLVVVILGHRLLGLLLLRLLLLGLLLLRLLLGLLLLRLLLLLLGLSLGILRLLGLIHERLRLLRILRLGLSPAWLLLRLSERPRVLGKLWLAMLAKLELLLSLIEDTIGLLLVVVLLRVVLTVLVTIVLLLSQSGLWNHVSCLGRRVMRWSLCCQAVVLLLLGTRLLVGVSRLRLQRWWLLLLLWSIWVRLLRLLLRLSRLTVSWRLSTWLAPCLASLSWLRLLLFLLIPTWVRGWPSLSRHWLSLTCTIVSARHTGN